LPELGIGYNELLEAAAKMRKKQRDEEARTDDSAYGLVPAGKRNLSCLEEIILLTSAL
jgi:hypothetical protein